MTQNNPVENVPDGGEEAPKKNVIEIEDLSKAKFKLSLAVFATLVTGIITVIGFIFYQYYQIRMSIDRNEMNIEKIEELMTVKKEVEPVADYRALKFVSTSVMEQQIDCEVVKEQVEGWGKLLEEQNCE